MKAKEKANELVQKYARLDHGLDEKKWKGTQVRYDEHHKQCAIICVDVIINDIEEKDLIDTDELGSVWIRSVDTYWQEVKQEIEKM
jgi:hypothetical protein